MKIWIEAEQLQSESTKLLEKGALHLLYKLHEEGFSIALDTEILNKRQRKLLEHEALIDSTSKEGADAILDYDKIEGKLVIWNGEEPCASGYDFEELIQTFRLGIPRTASVHRKTNETNISVAINLDGTGKSSIHTGLKFFDHMLDQIGRHGLIDLKLTCDGDLEVDEHHTVEDVAIALGEVITKALGDKKGIERYAFVLPMDEAQATVALDLSGRPYLVFEGEFNREYVGDLPTEMVKHFFYSLAMNLKATLHIKFDGDNDHHKIEAIFKGFARVLKTAVEKNPRIKNQIPSSKGAL